MKKIDWKINWRKLKFIPKSTGLRILLLATGLAEVLFLVLLFVLNVLPFTYVALIILAAGYLVFRYSDSFTRGITFLQLIPAGICILAGIAIYIGHEFE